MDGSLRVDKTEEVVPPRSGLIQCGGCAVLGSHLTELLCIKQDFMRVAPG